MTADSSRRSLAAFAQRIRGRVRSNVQRRREAEHGAGREADHERERQDAEVQRDVRGARQAVRIGDEESTNAGDGNTEAERGTKQRQHAAFDEKLPQQLDSSRTERRADCELLLTRLGARKQEVGQIRARNQQHEDDGALQHEHRRPRAADNLRLKQVEAHPVILRIRGMDTVGRRMNAVGGACRPCGQQRGSPVREHGFQLGARRGQSGAVAQSSNQVEIVIRAVLTIGGVQHQRHPDLRMLVRDVEAGRHDPHDGPASAIDLDLIADDVTAAAEGALPDLV